MGGGVIHEIIRRKKRSMGWCVDVEGVEGGFLGVGD